MARSLLSTLRTSISPSRRRSAKAAEEAKKVELFAQRLADVLGKVEEQERQLLDFAQRLAREEVKA